MPDTPDRRETQRNLGHPLPGMPEWVSPAQPDPPTPPTTPDRDAIRRRLDLLDAEQAAIDATFRAGLDLTAELLARHEEALREVRRHAPADIAALLAYTERLEKALDNLVAVANAHDMRSYPCEGYECDCWQRAVALARREGEA